MWWLDRMVRSTRPLDEKMTLFWHDHFATAEGDRPLLLRQNRTLRRHALGSFSALLEAVTADRAMLLFLSLADSDPRAPNENFARELMELFTLGRGYSERDVRQAALALTGFTARWPDDGPPTTSYAPARHFRGRTAILGSAGRHDWRDVLRIVCRHPRHAPFLVDKLWRYFVAEPLDARTRRALVAAYRGSGLRIDAVVARILGHRALYADLGSPDMVKSPLVYVAGMLRTTRVGVRRDDWAWLLDSMGQMPFSPPSVAGWEWGPAWMSSNAMKVRHAAVNYVTERGRLRVHDGSTPTRLTARQAVHRAHRAAGEPWCSAQTRREAARLAGRLLGGDDESHAWMRLQTRQDMVQRALLQLFLAGPDAQVH